MNKTLVLLMFLLCSQICFSKNTKEFKTNNCSEPLKRLDSMPTIKETHIFNNFLERFQLGIGAGVGIINPKDYDLYIDNLPKSPSGKSYDKRSFFNTDFSACFGFRINKKFDFNILGVYSQESRSRPLVDAYGQGFGLAEAILMRRRGLGMMVNYSIYNRPHFAFSLSTGFLYNKMSVESRDGNNFNGNAIGCRAQGAVNLLAKKHITFQVFIGGEYAKAETEKMEIDYSGMLIGINILFRKK